MIRDVDDADPGLVGIDADLTPGVVGVGPGVDNALRIVGVVRFHMAAREHRRCGIRQVDEVRARIAVGRADDVGETRVLVDRDVVRAADVAVVRRLGERDRRRRHAAQLRQVEHLHAVPEGLADDVGVVGVDLDVAPAGVGAVRRKVAQIDRILGVGDVDERGSAGAPHDRVLASGCRIGPTPNVVAATAADVRQRHESHEVHIVAGVNVGHAADAAGCGRSLEALSGLVVAEEPGALRLARRAVPIVLAWRVGENGCGAEAENQGQDGQQANERHRFPRGEALWKGCDSTLTTAVCVRMPGRKITHR